LLRQPDDDFAEAISVAQEEFDHHKPDVIVASSRGGAVAMNINNDDARHHNLAFTGR
jgi:alpha-beta hydrolase superfamily lysophospholipase